MDVKPVVIGIAASFFFAFTFVLNSSMQQSGGSWVWSASLRYLFMLPLLLCLVLFRHRLRPLLAEMKKNPGSWILWSTVGFGFFYAPLCLASAYSPGWLIAGTWQMTIISGTLLAPLFVETILTSNGPVQHRGKIPVKGLALSLVILLGIVLMQVEHAQGISPKSLLLGVIPVLLASVAYPLGNRKMMELCGGRLDTTQRVLGMTIASLPFWLLLSLYGLATAGLPSREQSLQALLVALFSGVIATVLFFKATDLVRGDLRKLASVEATQSMEVLFALAGELLFLSLPLPSPVAWFGMMLVVIGMILHSYASHRTTSPHARIQNTRPIER